MSPSRVGALLLERSARADEAIGGDVVGMRESGRDSVCSTTPAGNGDALSPLALLLLLGLRRIEAARTAREGT